MLGYRHFPKGLIMYINKRIRKLSNICASASMNNVNNARDINYCTHEKAAVILN